MNFKHSVLAAALVAGLPIAAAAQAAPAAPATAPADAPAAAKLPPPSAFPAKIALVNFIGAVEETNEGQRAGLEVQKKYDPKKDQLQTEATDLDALKKKLQGAPATMTDDERGRLTRDIDSKDKHLQSDYEEIQNSFQADLNDALQKVAAKVHDVMINYVQKNGYTLLLDYGSQQTSPLIWASQDQNADITEAVIQAYNASSGVAAPPPAAPSAGAPARRPMTGAGASHSTPAPHSATPAK